MFGSQIFYTLYISEEKQEKNFIFDHGYVKIHLAWKTLTLAFNFDCIVVKTNTTEIHEEDTGLQYAAAVRDDGMLGFLASGFSAHRLAARDRGALCGDQAG